MFRTRLWAIAIAAVFVLGASGAARAEVQAEVTSFDKLDGWAEDDHSAALDVFVKTCGDMKPLDWQTLCRIAKTTQNGRAFFEGFFRPVRFSDGTDALFTGYFEPELPGSAVQTDRFRYPLYALPSEAKTASRWLSRREIEQSGVLTGRGLELAWLDDPVDRMFLQVQGSGRIRFGDGTVLRLGYAGKNGHEYSFPGEGLVSRGIFERHELSAAVLRNWVRQNPVEGRDLLLNNASYVFFRKIEGGALEDGPRGAMNRAITANRTIAVDSRYTRLGSPVWIEKDGKSPINRLMVAQDTGSAIKGPQRADVFFGSGSDAGIEAGKIKDGGAMYVLLPIQRALALIPEVI